MSKILSFEHVSSTKMSEMLPHFYPARAIVLSCISHVQLGVTLWIVACQAPLSRGFSRQEYWSRFPCLLQRIFLTQGSNLCLLCLLHWQAGSFPLAPPEKALNLKNSACVSRVQHISNWPHSSVQTTCGL